MNTAPQESRLYQLLDAKFPDQRGRFGALSIHKLARHVGVTHAAIYKSIQKEFLGKTMAAKFVEASEGRLTKEELAQFMF